MAAINNVRDLTTEEEIVATLLELEGYQVFRDERVFESGKASTFLAFNPETKTAVPVLVSSKSDKDCWPTQLWDLDPNGSGMEIGDFIANDRAEVDQSCRDAMCRLGVEAVASVEPLVVGFYSNLKAEHEEYEAAINDGSMTAYEGETVDWEYSIDAEGFYEEDLIHNRINMHDFEFWDSSDINERAWDHRNTEPLESLLEGLNK